MGDKEQSGMLRTVVVVALVAIISLVVLLAAVALSVNATYTTLTSVARVSPITAVQNVNYRNAMNQMDGKGWDLGSDSSFKKAYSQSELAHMGSSWASASGFFTGQVGFSRYLAYNYRYEGSAAYDTPKFAKYSGSGSYYDVTPGGKLTNAPQWNILSVTTTDNKTYTFSQSFDPKNPYGVNGFQNDDNVKTIRNLFNDQSINQSSNSQYVSLNSITYDNGMTIHAGDSMFWTLSFGATNALAPYTPDGAFNSQIVTSGLQKQLVADNSVMQLYFATDLKIQLRVSNGWPYTMYTPGHKYQFTDARSFNNLSKQYPQEWDKLIGTH